MENGQIENSTPRESNDIERSYGPEEEVVVAGEEFEEIGEVNEDLTNSKEKNSFEPSTKPSTLTSVHLFNANLQDSISQQNAKFEEVWKEKKNSPTHKKLTEAYYKICPEDLVFFDVANQDKFVEETRKNYEKISSQYNIKSKEDETDGDSNKWDEKEMDRMFGKGLNPTSLITSLESAQWFTKNLKVEDNESTTVLDLGPGAGWSTVMLLNSLRRSFDKPKIISVDKSIHSMAASKTLLEYENIPHLIWSGDRDVNELQDWLESQEGKSFSGVVLVCQKYNPFVKSLKERSVDGIYSSHGTAYISDEEYKELFEDMQKVLRNGGIFVSDSLNPIYTNRLNLLLSMTQMLAPKKMAKILDKKEIKYIENNKIEIKSNSKYFKDQKVTVLQGFNTPHAYLIFKWSNYLIKSFNIKKFLDTKKSLDITMEVVEAYRDDVFPSYLLKDVVKNNNFKFEEMSGRPDFPIFMDTQGFRLKV